MTEPVEPTEPIEIPEIRFQRSKTQVLTIQVPELLEYTEREPALSQFKIAGDENTFIFPGLIVKTPETALYLPVSSLTRYEQPASPDVALAFDDAGKHYELSSDDVSNFGGQELLLCKDPLLLTNPDGGGGDVTVFGGSLLKTTHGALYYLPHGAFDTLTSIGDAIAAAEASEPDEPDPTGKSYPAS